MSALLVALGAACGAILRYLTDAAVRSRTASSWPWATLAVNVAGSLTLGLATSVWAGPALLLVGTGFCGALTTVSTFSWETLTLRSTGTIVRAGAYAVTSVVLAVAAAWLGTHLAG